MCSCDDNPAQDFESVMRQARKTHQCAECRRPIARGETYQANSGRWEDGWETYKWCAHCLAAQKIYRRHTGDDCFCFAALWEGIEEAASWHNGRQWTSDKVVLRLIAGARRKWTISRGRRRGELMPVPMLAGKAMVTS